MTICPNTLQLLKVSNGTSPVMQVADADVNKASINAALPCFELIGSVKSTAPIIMISANPTATIFGYVSE